MKLVAKRCSILYLLVVVCLIGSEKARAQSREDSRKRAFAALLDRRAKTARAESGGAIASATLPKSRTARSTISGLSTAAFPRVALSTSPLFARVAPMAASATGVSVATPVNPNGVGAHKDTFIESLYGQILGREPSVSELNYWSRVLTGGVAPEAVARAVWDSPEHQNLIRNGTAPGIPFKKAYPRAYDAAHPGQRVPWLN